MTVVSDPEPDQTDPSPPSRQEPQLLLLDMALRQFQQAQLAFDGARVALEQAVLLYTRQTQPPPPQGNCPVEGCTAAAAKVDTFGGGVVLCTVHGQQS